MPIPGRVDAALSFLYHAERVENPSPDFDGNRHEARDLSAREQKVQTAALDVLLDYFECKADFGDDPKFFTLDMCEQKKAERKTEAKV